ncbi:hypothetical protein [Tannockella kyphosi]|uniref:hypothetical protein n=1 Tax=Tannockella kyphosi TaxID=2899121 RepID=UPI002013953C|nr:hypothetical protein [Tannockella kyphosi]
MEITVNWVRDDEELNEFYEWKDYDDIEVITKYQLICVDDETMKDMIYGCFDLLDSHYFQQLLVVSNKKTSLCLEIDKSGKLIYRGTFDLKSQRNMINKVKNSTYQTLTYRMHDEGLAKEYGLTRKERTKKQYLEDKIDQMYVEEYDQFMTMCHQIGIKEKECLSKYILLKKKMEKGYTFLHELLYNEYVLNQ